MGLSTILQKTNKLIFHSDEINNLKLHAPWWNPTDNVTILFDKETFKLNPIIHQNTKENILLFDIIYRSVFLFLFVAILFQLKSLLLAIKEKTFFRIKNLHIIRNLSIIVGFWVIIKLILYEILPLFIPVNHIEESINFTTINESIIESIISALDFKMIFVSIILYVVSILFKEGYSLKEEANLTI
jgi:hypothetical protein